MKKLVLAIIILLVSAVPGFAHPRYNCDNPRLIREAKQYFDDCYFGPQDKWHQNRTWSRGKRINPPDYRVKRYPDRFIIESRVGVWPGEITCRAFYRSRTVYYGFRVDGSMFFTYPGY